jgi:hypothetical protein
MCVSSVNVSLRSLLIVELLPTLGYPIKPTVMLSEEEENAVNFNPIHCQQNYISMYW